MKLTILITVIIILELNMYKLMYLFCHEKYLKYKWKELEHYEILAKIFN